MFLTEKYEDEIDSTETSLPDSIRNNLSKQILSSQFYLKKKKNKKPPPNLFTSLLPSKSYKELGINPYFKNQGTINQLYFN